MDINNSAHLLISLIRIMELNNSSLQIKSLNNDCFSSSLLLSVLRVCVCGGGGGGGGGEGGGERGAVLRDCDISWVSSFLFCQYISNHKKM